MRRSSCRDVIRARQSQLILRQHEAVVAHRSDLIVRSGTRRFSEPPAERPRSGGGGGESRSAEQSPGGPGSPGLRADGE